VGEWELAHGASSIACALERVPRAMPVGIYWGSGVVLKHNVTKQSSISGVTYAFFGIPIFKDF
jgi:hypothetical protein